MDSYLSKSHVDVDVAAGAKGLKDSFWAGGFSFCLCQELSFNINLAVIVRIEHQLRKLM